MFLLFTTSIISYADSINDISIVRSDWNKLKKPLPVDKELSKEEIEVIVRRAIDELGGMSRFVKPEHKWVMIKPNIVQIAKAGNITDSRVVWALVKMIYESD